MSWNLLFFRSAFAAILLVLSFPPIGLYVLAPLSLILFLRPLFTMGFERKREVFLYASSFAFFTFCCSYYWLAHTFHEFGELNWFLSFSLMFLTIVLGSIFNGVFFAFWKLLADRLKFRQKSSFFRYGIFFVLILVWDHLDTRLFPWFPYMAFGENDYLIASSFYLKHIGWTLLFYGIVFLFLNPRLNQIGTPVFKRVVLSLFLLLGAGFLGKIHIQNSQKEHAERQPVALLQGNVGNFDKKLSKLKIMPTVRNVMGIYRDLVEEAAVEFKEYSEHVEGDPESWIFWPETSFPGFPLNDPGMMEQMKSWARLTRGLHLVGAYEEKITPFAGTETLLDYNIVLFYHEKHGYLNHYQKFIRMPFGEYVPGDRFFPEIYQKFPILNHFGQGKGHNFFTHPDEEGPVFIPLICYEILMSDFVKEFIAKAEKEHPGRQIILVNPTNDSWFGKTSEPFLHAVLSKWQAAKHGKALVRITNTGISMLVAPWGETLKIGPFDQEMVLFSELPVTKRMNRQSDEQASQN